MPTLSRHISSLTTNYFNAMYAADPDPWRFATSQYEAEKYAATLDALPRRRYRKALEIGCSIGVFTHKLSERCDDLVAVDVVASALDQAAARCQDRPNVSFERMQIPEQWPEGRYDLIFLSEVVYYFERADVERIARHVASSVEPAGDIVIIHWTGDTHYPLSGDEASEAFIAASASYAAPISSARAEEYRLDVLRANGHHHPWARKRQNDRAAASLSLPVDATA